MDRRISPRDLRVTLLGLAVLCVVTVGIGASVALMLAPAILLLLLLAAGIRPGEELIERLRERFTRPRVRGTANAPRPALPLVLRRVGRRMAAALAVRPPPVLAASVS